MSLDRGIVDRSESRSSEGSGVFPKTASPWPGEGTRLPQIDNDYDSGPATLLRSSPLRRALLTPVGILYSPVEQGA